MLKFRTIQALTVATAFGYWALRFITNPLHLHPVLLVTVAALAIVSEVSYRAGRKEQEEDLISNKVK